MRNGFFFKVIDEELVFKVRTGQGQKRSIGVSL